MDEKSNGGFEHNRQSLRIVEEIEQKYPRFPGLNLSWEVREGLVKHYTAYDHPSKRKDFDAKSSSLEAQIANLADEITYYSHDLDDGLDSDLLSEKELCKHVRLWRQATQIVEKEYGKLANESRRYFIIRCIIDMQVHDVVEESTEAKILAAGVRSADDVRLHARPLVTYSATRRDLNLELREYLYKNLYYNPIVHQPHERATRMLGDLFNYYLKHTNEVGRTGPRNASANSANTAPSAITSPA